MNDKRAELFPWRQGGKIGACPRSHIKLGDIFAHSPRSPLRGELVLRGDIALFLLKKTGLVPRTVSSPVLCQSRPLPAFYLWSWRSSDTEVGESLNGNVGGLVFDTITRY